MKRKTVQSLLLVPACVLASCSWSNHGAQQKSMAQASPALAPASSGALEGLNLSGTPVGQKFQAGFVECDTKNTCDGKPLKYGCDKDPNNNSMLLRLDDGTIVFDAKMGLDADGSPYSKTTPGTTDQAQTSFRYPLPGKPSVNADRVPFIVIPLGGFEQELDVEDGDVAAVVYGDKVVFALVADQGPVCKIGEGSIQLHEMLGHAVCLERSKNGDCRKLRNVGIEKGVTYFIFPRTRQKLIDDLTPENVNQRIEAVGAVSWQRLRRPTL